MLCAHVKAFALIALIAAACAPSLATSSTAAAPAGSMAPVLAPKLDLGPLVSSLTGEVGIWIARPGEREPIHSLNADEPLLAASLYKLAVLLEVERRVDAGTLTYSHKIEITDEDVTVDGSNEYPGTILTIDEALEQMITYSDNGAALALLRTLGPTATNAALARAGIPGFHVATDSDDDHTVTARALGTYFALLAQRALVSPAVSRRMYDRLLRQHVNDRIPALLPEGTRVAHKTGDLVGNVHDAGIVETAAGPLVVVILTRDAPDVDARSFIGEVTQVAYAAVGRMPRAAATGAGAPALAGGVVPHGTELPAWSGPAAGGGALALLGYAFLRIRGRARSSRPRGPWSRTMAVPDRSRRR